MEKSERALAKRTKLIFSFLKKINNQRQVLKFVDIQKCEGKDRMVFTNSYIAFWLDEDIAELPHCKDANIGNYPSMERLYNHWTDEMGKSNSVVKRVDADKLKLAIKNKSDLVRVGDTAFDAKMLKSLLEILDVNAVTISFHSSIKEVVGSAHGLSDVGYGLLLGCRPNSIGDSDALINVEA